jgi:hypothetical protein
MIESVIDHAAPVIDHADNRLERDRSPSSKWQTPMSATARRHQWGGSPRIAQQRTNRRNHAAGCLRFIPPEVS